MKYAMHVLRPNQPLEVIPYEPGTGPQEDIPFDEVRKIIEGFIAPMRVEYEGKNRPAFVDEDGDSRQLTFNPTASGIAHEEVVGTMVIIVAD